MRSKQDGTEMAPYASESRREIRTLGPGGRGNAESLADSVRRGITPALAKEAAESSLLQPAGAEKESHSAKQDEQEQNDDDKAEATTRPIPPAG